MKFKSRFTWFLLEIYFDSSLIRKSFILSAFSPLYLIRGEDVAINYEILSVFNELSISCTKQARIGVKNAAFADVHCGIAVII